MCVCVGIPEGNGVVLFRTLKEERYKEVTGVVLFEL